MNGIRHWTLGICAWALAAGLADAHPRVSVGFNFGFPVYGHRHCWHDCWDSYYYYRPRPVIIERPVYVQPAPVVVQQPQVIVQPQPQFQPSYTEPPPPPTVRPLSTSLTSAPAVNYADSAGVEQYLRELSNPDERVRGDAVMELGRMRADRAIDPLTATLAGDQSPAVRDSAARALGLIGSPRALTALTHAAQADRDRDVRRSAQFAVEIIQSNQRR